MASRTLPHSELLSRHDTLLESDEGERADVVVPKWLAQCILTLEREDISNMSKWKWLPFEVVRLSMSMKLCTGVTDGYICGTGAGDDDDDDFNLHDISWSAGCMYAYVCVGECIRSEQYSTEDINALRDLE